ncbi:MAG: PIN domain-containing protein, partial [Patescibacteria group bacterium]
MAKKETGSKIAVVQKRKLFVLDTNVFMEDATSLFKFEEHDLYIPMITLAELDKHKKGRDEINWQARSTSRYFDTLTANSANLEEGIPLSGCGHKDALGKLFFQTTYFDLPQLPLPNLPGQTNDNDIIGITRLLKDTRTEYADVVL